MAEPPPSSRTWLWGLLACSRSALRSVSATSSSANRRRPAAACCAAAAARRGDSSAGRARARHDSVPHPHPLTRSCLWMISPCHQISFQGDGRGWQRPSPAVEAAGTKPKRSSSRRVATRHSPSRSCRWRRRCSTHLGHHGHVCCEGITAEAFGTGPPRLPRRLQQHSPRRRRRPQLRRAFLHGRRRHSQATP